MLSVVPERTSENLDLLFGALADATRRGIVERLAVGEATVTELAAPFSISLPAISRHLKVLERASLITRSQQGRWRARGSPRRRSPARRRGSSLQERLWAERFDRLDDHLARLTSSGPTIQRPRPREESHDHDDAPQLALTRIVNAPRALVYQAFTDPDQFAAWWGPIGNSLPRDEIEFDVRPGGYQQWSEVFPAEPGIWTHGRIDLTDVVDGELLDGIMRITGQLPGASSRSRRGCASSSTTRPTDGRDSRSASGSPSTRVPDREWLGRGVHQAGRPARRARCLSGLTSAHRCRKRLRVGAATVGRGGIAFGAAVAGVACLVGCVASARARGQHIPGHARPRVAPVVVENRRPGTPRWLGPEATGRAVEVYASATDALPGDSVGVHVSTVPAARYRLVVYRLGWYHRVGARQMACSPGCDLDEQGAPEPVPLPDQDGRIVAGWPVT